MLCRVVFRKGSVLTQTITLLKTSYIWTPLAHRLSRLSLFALLLITVRCSRCHFQRYRFRFRSHLIITHIEMPYH